MFSKKHYIGYLHENDEYHKELKYRGIILVRRDNPYITKHIYKNIY